MPPPARLPNVRRRHAAAASLALIAALAVVPLGGSPAAAADAQTLTVDTLHPGHPVSPSLYGEFFEEINYAGVGGLYAELVRNRSFMDSATPATWGSAQAIPRVPGVSGSAIDLNGPSPSRYVSMPPNIVSGLSDFTIAAWVNLRSVDTWSRVFDFGTGQTVNMFLTPNAGGTGRPRFAITISGNGAEQQINSSVALPANQWTHLAVTLSGTTATLYLNGVARGVNPNMTLHPSSLGPTNQNWIGRSQYSADPLLNGSVDDVQIYNRALSAGEVQALNASPGSTTGGGAIAWYRFDEANGPAALDSSGSGNDATVHLGQSEWDLAEDGGGSASAALDAANPLNDKLTRSLRLDVASAGPGQRVGMANTGYFGIGVVPGRTYTASFYAKANNGFTGPLTVSLESADGSQTFVTARVGGLTAGWKQYSTTLTVPTGVAASTTNRFVVGIDNRGSDVTTVPTGTSVWLQVVSLFPPTYQNQPNGLRPDLVELLKAMKPGFLRFPGGNYVEGNYRPQDPDPRASRWDWRKTVGPVAERLGHSNATWGYWSDDGLGLFEYLRLAEDLDVTPIIGVYAGLSIGNFGGAQVVPQNQLQPYIQEALDLIEYVIGPVTSPWGARRAADGHPAPFPTPYIEIGNEDNLNNGGPSYFAYRYPMFYDAIKAAYPQVTMIATTCPAGGCAQMSRPVEVIDEHFYTSSASFQSLATRYDSFNRGGPKVFVGEFGATAGAGGLPTGFLGNSMGEAAFMTGLERNSDIVTMASFAPLFAYYGHTQWNPDLIGFDQLISYGSTSYHVHQMFGSGVGDRVLPTTSDGSGLFFSSTIDTATGNIYTKIVNPSGTSQPTVLSFAGSDATEANIRVLGDPDPNAGNTLQNPNRVTPQTSVLRGSGRTFDYVVPANSATVVTIAPPVPDQLNNLTAFVGGLPIGAGIQNSLQVKLRQAATHYANGEDQQAINVLNAFANQVRSLRAEAVLTADDAKHLVAAANTISTHIG
jgi:alpha-L-arabinofuranosidase